MRVLGIAGTAKNTGKTTTLLEVLGYLSSLGRRVFVTSIGYDGEDFDNITGLPKPRVFIPEGTLVATALPLIQASSVKFTDLQDTGVRCALGRVFVGRASAGGKVVLAGPTSTRDLLSVMKFAPKMCTVLLDGAFSRLSPMVVAGALILATGAARSPDSHRLAREVEIIGKIMSLPVHGFFASGSSPGGDPGSAGRTINVEGGLFLKGQGKELGWRLIADGPGQTVVYVRGIVNPAVFDETLSELEGYRRDPVVFVISHPILMLLSGDVLAWEDVLCRAEEMGFVVAVGSSSELLGVTINPYRPSYESATGRFVATYLPPRTFLDDIRNLTSVPCTDIILEGPEKLRSWLHRYVEKQNS